MSCGQHSVIVANGLNPETAMLRGQEAGYWLASFSANDLAAINGELGLNLHFVLDENNADEPWHGNIFGLPDNGSDALEDVQFKLEQRAKWVKPPHSERLDNWFPGALERANRARGQNKVNELKNLRDMLNLPDFPDAATRRASVEAILNKAIAALPRKVQCKACGAPTNEYYAKKESACPKCKASPFTWEPVGAEGGST